MYGKGKKIYTDIYRSDFWSYTPKWVGKHPTCRWWMFFLYNFGDCCCFRHITNLTSYSSYNVLVSFLPSTGWHISIHLSVYKTQYKSPHTTYWHTNHFNNYNSTELIVLCSICSYIKNHKCVTFSLIFIDLFFCLQHRLMRFGLDWTTGKQRGCLSGVTTLLSASPAGILGNQPSPETKKTVFS